MQKELTADDVQEVETSNTIAKWKITFTKDPEEDYEKQFGPIDWDTDPSHVNALAVYKLCKLIVNEPNVEETLDKLMDNIENISPDRLTPVENMIYNWLQTLSAVEDGDYR